MKRSTRHRLFVALWPDDLVRAALAGARDGWTWSEAARPTPIGNLHVTLVFLGDLSSNRMPDVVDGLAVGFEPFALRLDSHALWGNGIAALETARDCPALVALQAGVAGRTAALGFAPEPRRYRPHVTLARDARGSIAPEAPRFVSWDVSSYALMESRGGRYRTIATWPSAAS